jgi:hypothetical protein
VNSIPVVTPPISAVQVSVYDAVADVQTVIIVPALYPVPFVT